MFGVFAPQFSGKARIETPGAAFLDRFKDRVEIGLLTGHPHWRSRYVVTDHTDSELAFRASGIATGINIGLNDVRMRLSPNGGIEYLVSYRIWAAYCVILGALLGVALVLTVTVMGGGTPESYLVRYSGFNEQTSLILFGGMVVFWGLIWPWILIAWHKPFARRALNRIIAEVDGQTA